MNAGFFGGLLAGLTLNLQAFMAVWMLMGLAALFTVIWFMPRRLVAITAALATMICYLLRSLL